MHVGNIIWKIIFPLLHAFWQKNKCFAFHYKCFPYYCRRYSGSRKRALTMAKTSYICLLFIAKRMIKCQRMYFGYFSKHGLSEACHFWGCIHKWLVVSYTMYVTLCIVVRPCRPRSDRIFVFPSGDSSEHKYCGHQIHSPSMQSIYCFPINVCSPCASWLH